MTLEKKFKVVMKNFEATTTNNEELKNQNAYLSRLLAESMKQKRRNLVSASTSPGFDKEAEAQWGDLHLVSTSDKDP